MKHSVYPMVDCHYIVVITMNMNPTKRIRLHFTLSSFEGSNPSPFCRYFASAKVSTCQYFTNVKVLTCTLKTAQYRTNKRNGNSRNALQL